MSMQAKTCSDLQFIIDNEITSDNVFLSEPKMVNWPRNESVFAALNNDLNLATYQRPATVQHSICTNSHFGWHDECQSVEYKDLLVSGITHLKEITT